MTTQGKTIAVAVMTIRHTTFAVGQRTAKVPPSNVLPYTVSYLRRAQTNIHYQQI